ncbi:MAG: hypothetical protein LBF25_00685 [Puniceicoccales bacterium]|nr:hypothetical protein [Puniceicoccales bacterium]
MGFFRNVAFPNSALSYLQTKTHGSTEELNPYLPESILNKISLSLKRSKF